MKAVDIRGVILLLGVLFLAACGAGGEDSPVEAEVQTLVLATVSGNVDREMVSRFNLAHSDVQIEVKDYSERGKITDAGIDQLMSEIIAGQIPDIIELGTNTRQLPVRQLAQKGYLENLWPYIENDPDLGRDSLVKAPIEAAKINGALYFSFGSVVINTLVGPERITGKRYSWTVENLEEAFQAMPEDSTIVQYCDTKLDMLYYLFHFNLGHWIDWETGKVSFDDEEFRSYLEFVNEFPLEFDWSDPETVNEEIGSRMLSGRQMLTNTNISSPLNVQIMDAAFHEKTAFIGYPTLDGSIGSCFYFADEQFAMSAACQNKEAAWEFIRLPFLCEKSQIDPAIPVNQEEFDIWLNCERRLEPLTYSSIEIDLHQPTQEEKDRFLDFFNRVDKVVQVNNTVFHIVKDQCGPYFAGDKTLDETINLIQRRVSLYVNEQF